jgi:hypothetical protein
LSFVSATTNNALTLSGTNTLTVTGLLSIPNPSTDRGSNVNVNNGILTCGSLTTSGSTTRNLTNINIIGGTLDINGTYTSVNTGGTFINITGTGTLIFGGSVSALFTLTPGASSTVKYDRNGTQTCRTATYNNLTLAGTGVKTVTSCTVNNVLQIDSTATLNAAITYGGAAAGLKYNTTQARTTSLFEWPATFSGTGGVTISNTGIITLNAAKVFGNSSELIITANAQLNTGNFSIDFGGDFIKSGTFTAGSSPINISGTATTQNIAGFTTTGTLTLTKTGGTATFTGNVTAGPLTLNGNLGSLSCGTANTHTFSKFNRGPGTLLGGSSTINFTDSAFSATGTFTPETSTVRWISNEASQAVASVTYYNVEFGGSGIKATTTFTTVNNNFIMSGATTTTQSANLTVGGNFTLGDGTTYNTAAFSLAVTGTTTIGGGSNGLLNINDATQTLTFGDFILSTGGTISNDVNAPYTINGNFSNNGNFNSGTGNITFAGTNKTFGGNVQASFKNMVISGTYTLNSNINSAGTITGAGTLTMGSTGTLIINSNTNPSVSNFITTTTGNTVNYGLAGAQSILTKTYYNLLCSNSGVKTISGNTSVNNNFEMSGTITTTQSANLTVGGDFTIGDGTTYNSGAFNLAVAGTTTIGGGSNGILNINNATPIISFGNLTIANGGLLTNTANASCSISGNFINNGNYNSGSGNITFTGTNKTFGGNVQATFTNMVISGTYTLNSNINNVGTISGAGTLTMGSTGVLNINSSTNPSVTNFITTTTGNTVIYTLAGAQTMLAKTYYNLTCNNSGIKTFGGNTTVLGNYNLTDLAEINASTFTHSFKGNFTTNSGTSGVALTNSKFIFDGNTTQIISVVRTIGFKPAKLFTANGEKIFNSSVSIIVTDSLNIASGSILNLSGISTINIAGKLTGLGTLKFGSCISPSTAQVTFSYTGGNTSVLNFEPLFNQLGNLTINIGALNSATFQNDLIVSTNLTLTTGNAVINGSLSLDGSTPLTTTGGRLNFATTGSLIFGNCVSTGTAFTIPNNVFSSAPTIKNLSIFRTNGITLGNQMISVSDVLTLVAGNLATNNNLSLLSTATNTARVAPILNGSVVSGNVIINRFIPGGSNKRKWRLLSSPVNVSGSIALSQFIDDILVTAPTASGGGFDVSPNNAASIRTYTESTSGASGLGWTGPTNTTNTVATGTGMEVFVRGTRGLANPYLNWTTPDNVTIDFIGVLNTGSVTKTLTYTPSVGGATTADGFNLVGNPYASPINFDTASNWTKTNIENKFWCYNPNTSNYGIYDAVAHTGTNGITRYIASGQAFFVRATSASAPRITFTENVKCKQIGNSYFKPNKNPAAFPMLRMTLIDDSADFDEALILIDSVNGTPQPTDDRDAAKFFNDALNIYTVTANKSNLAFNAINVPGASDTINVSVWSYDSTSISTKHHKISFSEFESIDPSINLYLLDNYLNVVTNIRSTNEYDFMITTDVNSYGNGRFKIILNNTNTSLPTTFKKQNIVLYPNPANEKLYLQSLDFSTSTINYIIYDLMGREIMKGNSSLENSISEINIDTLEKGNYLIRVSDNTQTNTMKFVKR